MVLLGHIKRTLNLVGDEIALDDNMPLDLSDTLVVGISATALFDLSEADQIFRAAFTSNQDTAIEKYRQHMMGKEALPLELGTGECIPVMR